ncbi:hypothetical protein KEM54_001408 [Ascosphaera aggregata]|nr:hypothetical protein KEM54_001408 [Ascosphaera aggregata]
MSSLFVKRRGPRTIHTIEDDDESETDGPIVVRQAPRKQRQRPALPQKRRVDREVGKEGGGNGADGKEEEEDESIVVRPRKLGLNARTFEQSAFAATASPSTSASVLSAPRPTYTTEEIQALKHSTPSLPRDLVRNNDKDQSDQSTQSKQVDIAAKFGEIVHVAQPSHIPSEAEIKEKKERRARLAKEYAAEEFISLEDDVSPNEDWDLARRDKETAETRLVRDDEDFAEGFDEYVEDGQIALGAKAERARRQKQRNEMRELIEAEETSDDEDTDAENKAAYEEAQTRAAIYGQTRDVKVPVRPMTPPKIVPLPRLSDSIIRLQTSLGILESTKTQLLQRMEELRREKIEIANREEEIQRLLKETGDKYAKLKAETGDAPTSAELIMDAPGGLENLGTLKVPDATPSDV